MQRPTPLRGRVPPRGQLWRRHPAHHGGDGAAYQKGRRASPAVRDRASFATETRKDSLTFSMLRNLARQRCLSLSTGCMPPISPEMDMHSSSRPGKDKSGQKIRTRAGLAVLRGPGGFLLAQNLAGGQEARGPARPRRISGAVTHCWRVRAPGDRTHATHNPKLCHDLYIGRIDSGCNRTRTYLYPLVWEQCLDQHTVSPLPFLHWRPFSS